MSAGQIWITGSFSSGKLLFSFFVLSQIHHSAYIVRLSRALSSDPYRFRGPASQHHLRLLDKLLSPTSSVQAMGQRAEDLRIDISSYLLRHELYPLLAKALENIVRRDHLPLNPFLMHL
jgi:hypothetical protein